MNDTPEVQKAMLATTKTIFEAISGKSYEYGLKILVTCLVGLVSGLPKKVQPEAIVMSMALLAKGYEELDKFEKSGKH